MGIEHLLEQAWGPVGKGSPTLAEEAIPTNRMGFDAEFDPRRKAGEWQKVYSIQLCLGDNPNELQTVVCCACHGGPENFWRNLYRLSPERKTTLLEGWNARVDIGAIQDWFPWAERFRAGGVGRPVKAYLKNPRKVGVQERCSFGFGRRKFQAIDLKPFGVAVGAKQLADLESVVGLPKLRGAIDGLDGKPYQWWMENMDLLFKEHHDVASDYAGRDAEVTHLFGNLLSKHFDLLRVATAGGMSKIYMGNSSLPKTKVGKSVYYLTSELERQVRSLMVGQRNECFRTGYFPMGYYNDVSGLHALSELISDAPSIGDPLHPEKAPVERCELEDLRIDFDEACHSDYGWICGVFETENDLWGLPVVGERNRFIVGRVEGVYHTNELAAARAKVLDYTWACKPIFYNRWNRDLYLQDYHARLDMKMPKLERGLRKMRLVAFPGKTGEIKPVVRAHTNFLSQSSMYATSHLFMRQLLERYPGTVFYTDTDCVAGDAEWAPKGTMRNGVEWALKVEKKGEFYIFRSKRYVCRDLNGNFSGAYMGWVYRREDLWDIIKQEFPDSLEATSQVVKTAKTKAKEVEGLSYGGWITRKRQLDRSDQRTLLSADTKRKRPDYDSYELCRNRESVGSKAWNLNELREFDFKAALVRDRPMWRVELEDFRSRLAKIDPLAFARMMGET